MSPGSCSAGNIKYGEAHNIQGLLTAACLWNHQGSAALGQCLTGLRSGTSSEAAGGCSPWLRSSHQQQ